MLERASKTILCHLDYLLLLFHEPQQNSFIFHGGSTTTGLTGHLKPTNAFEPVQVISVYYQFGRKGLEVCEEILTFIQYKGQGQVAFFHQY